MSGDRAYCTHRCTIRQVRGEGGGATMAGETFVILGAGQAGGGAAETLREEGFDGRIVIVGDEPERPYERPPLSKGFLLGTTAADRLYLQPAPFYAEHEIELLTGTAVTSVSPDRHLVELADGQHLTYDRLLIATGVSPRTLPVPGVDLPGVQVLRTLNDAARLAAAFERSPRVLVVGAGFIGAEFAAACRAHGLEVTMLDVASAPLVQHLGRRIGDLFAQIHRDEGVGLLMDTGVAAFRGEGRVEEAVLDNGERVPCDLVLVGIGCAPDTAFLAGSGVEREDGIAVDEYCRTSVPHIHAAGDVARWWHPVLQERLRVEHWQNAVAQGRAAARSMLGTLEPYAPLPYFWSDQYSHALQVLGRRRAGDQSVLRGSLESRAFTLFYLHEGIPIAALILNRPRDTAIVRRLLTARAPVDRALLADEGADLRSLLGRG